MAHVARLAARIVVAWGLTLAPSAFGQQPTSPEMSLSAKSEPNKAVRQTGTVKFYNAQKGYGFIKPDDGDGDIFVHHSVVEHSGIGALVEGMRISFETEPGMHGKGKAVNLQPIGTGTAELPKPPELPEKSAKPPSSSSETSLSAKPNVESEPKKAAADGSLDEEWKVCSSSGFSDSVKAVEACTRLIAQGEAVPPSRRAEAFLKRGQLKGLFLSLSKPDKVAQAKMIDDYTEAIRLDPSQSLAYLERGILTASMNGDSKRAIADLSEVIRLDSVNSRAYHVRGLQHAKQGDLDQALADLTKAIDLKPDSVMYEARAEIYEKKDQLEAAFKDFEAGAGLAPKNSFSAELLQRARDRVGRPLAKYHADRGQLAAQNGDIDLAILDFNSALDYDPYNWRANIGRGAIYLQRGDLSKARADIRTAIQQFSLTKPGDWPPEIATAQVTLGEIYEKQREFGAALFAYQEALKANRTLSDAENIRARIDRIRLLYK